METNELIISRHNRHCLQCRSIAHNAKYWFSKAIPILQLKNGFIEPIGLQIGDSWRFSRQFCQCAVRCLVLNKYFFERGAVDFIINN